MLTASDVVALGGRVVSTASQARSAVGLVTDSRSVEPGNAFVAIQGARHHGDDFVPMAVERGAALIVTTRPTRVEGADVVQVGDGTVFLERLARAHLAAWRKRSAVVPARTIAITGSAGKTTTKHIAAALASAVRPTWATRGNLNNRVGMPLVALSVTDVHRFVVLEIGMSLPGEIASLTSVAQPDVAVITNIGLAHAEGVGGSLADVAREKGAIFEGLAPEGVAVVNADDDAVLAQLNGIRARRTLSFGRSEVADYRLMAIANRGLAGGRVTFGRPRLCLRSPTEREVLEIDLPLYGEHAAVDFLAALAAVECALGEALPPGVIEVAVRELTPLRQRGDVLRLGRQVTVLDDSYNANPESMRAALAALGNLADQEKRRAIAVLGEMKELGPAAAEAHADLGEDVARAGVALLVGCGGLIDRTLESASRRGVPVLSATDVQGATSAVLRELRDGDLVLVKASNSVGAHALVLALASTLGVA